METLLDHHLVAFDGWFHAYLMSLPGPLPLSALPQWHRHYLTAVTLLDQLDLEEHDWQRLSVILLNWSSLEYNRLPDLFSRTKVNIEFCRIVSKFLTDRERAGLFWVNSQKYADLAEWVLEFLLHA